MRTSDPADAARLHGMTFRPGGLRLTERACDLAGVGAGARLLDVGCGAGGTLRFLRSRGVDACGAEPDERMRSLCLADGLPVEDGRAESLPFGNEAFDAVLFECALSLAADRKRAAAEAARVLVPGGRVIVADLCRPERDAGARDDFADCGGSAGGCAAGALTPGGWVALLEGAGFTVIVLEDHTDDLKSFVAKCIFCDLSLPFACPRAGRRSRRGYLLLVGRKGVSDGE